MQIRENEQGGNLKDVTVGKGERFRFTHPQSVTTDLWITIDPTSVAMLSLNGQQIKASKNIHLDKK